MSDDDDLPFAEEIVEENVYATMIQPINVSVNLGREPMGELGRRSPYFHFPASLFGESVSMMTGPACSGAFLPLPAVVCSGVLPYFPFDI